MKSIKIVIACTVFLFFANTLMAQDCEFNKDENDKFTKERTLHTKPVKATSGKIKLKNVYTIDKVEMQVKLEKSSYLIYLRYYFGLGMSVATTNDKLILLLKDGSTIEAPCAQNIPDQEIKGVGTAILSYTFKLSEEDFIKLTKNDITDIRMTAQVNPVDFEIAKEMMTSKLFNCVWQNK